MCHSLNLQEIICFACPNRSCGDRGAIGIFHVRCVILDMCLFTIIHEKGAGNWNAQFHAQIEKIIPNKTPPWLMLVWTVPEDSASRGVWLIGGRESKLYFSVWEPPIACVAWKMVRTLGHCVDNESMPPKIIISVFKAWALAPLQINASLYEGPVCLCSCWVILLLWKHQLESTSVIFMLCF